MQAAARRAAAAAAASFHSTAASLSKSTPHIRFAVREKRADAKSALKNLLLNGSIYQESSYKQMRQQKVSGKSKVRSSSGKKNPLSKSKLHLCSTTTAGAVAKGSWMKGTFLMLLANVTWSLWIVLQASLLKEYPNKLLTTALQCLLSTVSPSRWRRFVVTGVSYYLQVWCIERRGPVFLAMSNPLGLVLTVFCSFFFLGEVVPLGSVLGGALLVARLS